MVADDGTGVDLKQNQQEKVIKKTYLGINLQHFGHFDHQIWKGLLSDHRIFTVAPTSVAVRNQKTLIIGVQSWNSHKFLSMGSTSFSSWNCCN